jgi:hypothetical protein
MEGIAMKYSHDDIRKDTQTRMAKLKKDGYKIENLPNYAPLYYNDKEKRDSQAIQNANPKSRLFREISIDGGHTHD